MASRYSGGSDRPVAIAVDNPWPYWEQDDIWHATMCQEPSKVYFDLTRPRAAEIIYPELPIVAGPTRQTPTIFWDGVNYTTYRYMWPDITVGKPPLEQKYAVLPSGDEGYVIGGNGVSIGPPPEDWRQERGAAFQLLAAWRELSPADPDLEQRNGTLRFRGTANSVCRSGIIADNLTTSHRVTLRQSQNFRPVRDIVQAGAHNGDSITWDLPFAQAWPVPRTINGHRVPCVVPAGSMTFYCGQTCQLVPGLSIATTPIPLASIDWLLIPSDREITFWFAVTVRETFGHADELRALLSKTNLFRTANPAQNVPPDWEGTVVIPAYQTVFIPGDSNAELWFQSPRELQLEYYTVSPTPWTMNEPRMPDGLVQCVGVTVAADSHGSSVPPEWAKRPLSQIEFFGPTVDAEGLLLEGGDFTASGYWTSAITTSAISDRKILVDEMPHGGGISQPIT